MTGAMPLRSKAPTWLLNVIPTRSQLDGDVGEVPLYF